MVGPRHASQEIHIATAIANDIEDIEDIEAASPPKTTAEVLEGEPVVALAANSCIDISAVPSALQENEVAPDPDPFVACEPGCASPLQPEGWSDMTSAQQLNQQALAPCSIPIQWSDICVSTTHNGQIRQLVSGLSGCAAAGEMVAIIGPSGCGKTVFLNSLVGLCSPSLHQSGAVSQPSTTYLTRIGYCRQNDTLLSTDTPREAAMERAQQLFPDLSHELRASKVQELLEDLGLTGVADERIGCNGDSSSARLSGGQRRRVQVLLELIGPPSVLLLDEPTSGLDAAVALDLVSTLLQLASKYQTAVVCSIHQPRPIVFSMFSSVLILSEAGEQKFFGSQDALERALGDTESLPDYISDAIKLQQQPDFMSSTAAAARIADSKVEPSSPRRKSLQSITMRDKDFYTKLQHNSPPSYDDKRMQMAPMLLATPGGGTLLQVSTTLQAIVRHHWRDRVLLTWAARLIVSVVVMCSVYHSTPAVSTADGLGQRVMLIFYLLGALMLFENHASEHVDLFSKMSH